MKVREIIAHLENPTLHVTPEGDRDVQSGIAGDLLSFVMGEAPHGSLWVTIHNHVNVAAVAVLKEMPLVILACGRKPSQELLVQCQKEGIALASVETDTFSLCGRLYQLGIGTDGGA